MNDNGIERLARLTAILTQLQTKRLLTSTTLAVKFGVTVRTIYRDIKVLQQAGVPIFAEDGKGYSLMEGYKIPPVMFTEIEANALITAGQIVLKNGDTSLIAAYTEAIDKIKAVLAYATKAKTDLLANRIAVSPALLNPDSSNSLTLIQSAMTDFNILRVTYLSEYKGETTQREIEPFAFYYNLQENWTVIAYCRLRKDYRMFRLSRISKIEAIDIKFAPHKLTLKEFLVSKEKNFKTPDIPLS